MINILVTSAGGPAGIGLIKSIKSSSYSSTTNITAVDADPLSVGFHLADQFEVIPRASEPNYWTSLLSVIKNHKINLIISNGENDMYYLSKYRNFLKEKFNCTVYISDNEVIDICNDKFKFYLFLKKNNIKTPFTFSKKLILKPNKGSGSKNMEIINPKNKIIQEYIEGREFTVDVFCDMDSNIINHVIRERLAIRGGISSKGRIVKDPNITNIITKIVKALKPKGPICIQLIKNKEEEYYVIECNPRLGGGTYFCTLAGVNYAKLYLDLFKGNVDKSSQKPAKCITVIRQFDEIVI